MCGKNRNVTLCDKGGRLTNESAITTFSINVKAMVVVYLNSTFVRDANSFPFRTSASESNFGCGLQHIALTN